ncbi:hypothetical protein DIPPA_34689 [Diplonema papillatum]|nr:hypothetical protein DIPPA_34689 [Diplonema papillatum]
MAADPPPPAPGQGIKWRIVTHNVWGVGVLDPMTRPKRSVKAVTDLATAEGWDTVPFVVGLQEVYSFRLDPLSWWLTLMTKKGEDWLYLNCPTHFGLQLFFLYMTSIVMHVVVVIINALLLYPVNAFRFSLVPQVSFDIKRYVMPVLHRALTARHTKDTKDCQHVIGHSGLTYSSNLAKLGDAGLLLYCGGGLTHADTTCGFEPFTHAMGSEVCCNKGLLWTVFKGQRVAVVNTHMQASDDPFRWVIGDSSAYKRQVKQTRALVDSLLARFSLLHVFLIGDLNTLGFERKQVEDTFGMHQLSTHVETHVDGCVDHVLCTTKFDSSQVSCRVLKTPSDHAMIVVEIL